MAYEVTDPLYPVEWRCGGDEYDEIGENAYSCECTAFEPERAVGSPPKETRCTFTQELFGK